MLSSSVLSILYSALLVSLYFIVKVLLGASVILQITELREKLESCHKKVEEVRKLERKKDEFVTRLDTVERTKNQLERGLQVNYPHPTEKLNQMLSSFERDFQVIKIFVFEI